MTSPREPAGLPDHLRQLGDAGHGRPQRDAGLLLRRGEVPGPRGRGGSRPCARGGRGGRRRRRGRVDPAGSRPCAGRGGAGPGPAGGARPRRRRASASASTPCAPRRPRRRSRPAPCSSTTCRAASPTPDAGAAARLRVPYVAMHWRGPSAHMESLAVYDDVVRDVRCELSARLDAAVASGLDPAASSSTPVSVSPSWRTTTGCSSLISTSSTPSVALCSSARPASGSSGPC